MKVADCDNCQQKKRKCGKELPQCQNCIAVGLGCHYKTAPATGGGTTAAGARTKVLEERLKKLEAIVQALHLDEANGSDDGNSISLSVVPQNSNSNPNDMMHSSSNAITTGGVTLSPNQASSASPTPRLQFQNQPNSVVPASPAFSLAPFPSHVDALRTDLEDLFFSTGSSYLLLTEPQSRKAIQESFFLRFVVYSLASSHAPPSMVSAEFGSRNAMAEAYFKRSESFLRRVFRKPSYHGVLGLFGLILYCTRTNRGPEAFYYYTVGVRIAHSLGLNSEASYSRANLNDEQKETMRATWWTVYMADRMMSALRFEPPLIKDSDCGVKLPSPLQIMSHPQDHVGALQISIMSSQEWYVPTPRNLSAQAYLLILVKIHGRIIAFSQDTKSERKVISQAEFLFREAALSAALRDWHAAVPDNVRNVLVDINGDLPPNDPKTVWGNAYIMILFYCIKLYLPKQSLLTNIQENAGLAASCSAARDIFLAGCDLAGILQCFLKHNPQFLYVPPFVASCIFGASLMVLIVSRMNLNPNDVTMAEISLSTFLSCLSNHANAFNMGNPQKEFLERLATCRDPVLLCIAIKQLKNMRGESVAASTKMLLSSGAGDQVGNDDEEDEVEGREGADSFPVLEMDPHRFNNAVLQMPHATNNPSYTDPAFLESAVLMSDPYTEFLLGSGNPDFTHFNNLGGFDFNFNMNTSG